MLLAVDDASLVALCVHAARLVELGDEGGRLGVDVRLSGSPPAPVLVSRADPPGCGGGGVAAVVVVIVQVTGLGDAAGQGPSHLSASYGARGSALMAESWLGKRAGLGMVFYSGSK